MSFPSSLLHVIVGMGYPEASHLRLTLDLSSTTVSELVSLSIMAGGTERDNTQNKYNNLWKRYLVSLVMFVICDITGF